MVLQPVAPPLDPDRIPRGWVRRVSGNKGRPAESVLSKFLFLQPLLCRPNWSLFCPYSYALCIHRFSGTSGLLSDWNLLFLLSDFREHCRCRSCPLYNRMTRPFEIYSHCSTAAIRLRCLHHISCYRGPWWSPSHWCCKSQAGWRMCCLPGRYMVYYYNTL